MRQYSFDLPYYIPPMYVSWIHNFMMDSGMNYPEPVLLKLRSAMSNWQGVEVTREDLDSIPDPEWNYLSQRIGL